MLGVAHDPIALLVIGGDAKVAPRVTIDRYFAIAIEVVEQHVIAGKLVLVWRDVFAEHADLRLAITQRFSAGVFQVAEHLIVRTIFLDDVEHMLDRAGIADLAGDDRFIRLRRRF